ncbi:hypothetical protein [Oceanococcus atlanticus]|uniref:hypothetical protein n=1 Tax=Oceanococcus atlanticus TaxID=1317117 RepID=UPI0011BA5A0E|nr:hypothetical protein [Oceanococcus atlanticus]
MTPVPNKQLLAQAVEHFQLEKPCFYRVVRNWLLFAIPMKALNNEWSFHIAGDEPDGRYYGVVSSPVLAANALGHARTRSRWYVPEGKPARLVTELSEEARFYLDGYITKEQATIEQVFVIANPVQFLQAHWPLIEGPQPSGAGSSFSNDDVVASVLPMDLLAAHMKSIDDSQEE